MFESIIAGINNILDYIVSWPSWVYLAIFLIVIGASTLELRIKKLQERIAELEAGK